MNELQDVSVYNIVHELSLVFLFIFDQRKLLIASTADRAKQIKTTATVNEDPTEKLIRNLKEENDKLKALLEKANAGESIGKIDDDDDDDDDNEGLSEEGIVIFQAHRSQLLSMSHFAEISGVHNENVRCASVGLSIVHFKCAP